MCMLCACGLLSCMGTLVYAATLLDHPVAAPMLSFIRVAVNLLVLLVPALISRRSAALLGDRRASLWLRGLFGGVSLILSFASIQRIGPGESAFLTASSGIFVAALSPQMLGQRSQRRDWLAIAGALLGLYLLLQPELKDSDLVGRLLGLASGFLAALAYLMIARAGRSNSPRTVVFYFSLVAVLIHLGWFAWRDCSWPADGQAWALALLAGLTGSAAQSFLTRAYQMAPAAQVSAVAYCGPVMSLMLGALLFKQTPNAIALGGCGLVLLSGMLLPFLSARTAKP